MKTNEKRWVMWHGDTGICFAFSAEPLQPGEVECENIHRFFHAGAVESAEEDPSLEMTLTTEDQSYWEANGEIERNR